VNRKGFVVIEETDELIRELLERWLAEEGYCLSAAPGQSALLVILDIPTPRGAQSRISALQKEYAAPLLLLSARFRRGLAGSVEAARRLGVKKVLPKPFTREELLAAVDESLEGAE
jgi:DNA-binding response OmpR family regulator